MLNWNALGDMLLILARKRFTTLVKLEKDDITQVHVVGTVGMFNLKLDLWN